MSQRANPALIGGFVLGGIAIAIAAVLALGSGRFFETRQRFVLYFDEAVTGLSVGAPVIFKGVEVGNVTAIGVVIDYGRDTVEVPVTVEIVTSRVQVRGESRGPVRGVEEQVRRGMRARLSTLSILTGQLYIGLYYFPDKPPVFKKVESDLPEIPTVASELAEIRNTVGGLVDRIRALPLEELVARLASASAGIDKLVNKPELADAILQLDKTLAEARSTIARIDRRVDPLVDKTEATIASAHEAVTRLGVAVADAGQVVQPGSPVQVQLLAVLEELERAARSVRTLADSLAERPDAIVFGKGDAAK